MKKHLLFLLISFFTLTIHAQEVEIYYPSFQFNDGTKGVTRFNVQNGFDESLLWSTLENAFPANLGYTPAAEQRALRALGYGKDKQTYGITDTYAVINAVNLSTVPNEKDIKLSFWTIAEYFGGPIKSIFSVLVSTNFSGDPMNSDWTDVTSQLDQIDVDDPYDATWTKSTLNLNPWRNATNFVLAFRYQIPSSGTVNTSVTPKERPGRWQVCEVKFTYNDATITAVNDLNESTQEHFYPNPASNHIKLTADVNSIAIYTVTGETLKQIDNPSHTVDLSDLSNGVYIVKLVLKNGSVSTRKLLLRK